MIPKTTIWHASAMCLCLSQTASADIALDTFALLDLRSVVVDGSSDNWLTGGLEPLRFDSSGTALQLGQAIFGTNVDFTPFVKLSGYVSAYDDDGESLGLNELFLTYRPLPINGYRLSGRAGIFFPEISLENTSPGWTSTHVLSNSAINAWIGEEIKNTGVEIKLERLGKYHFSSWDAAVEIAAFEANDPAGSLLTWRGWGIHDRQIRYQEQTRFAALPMLTEAGVFNAQSPYFDPNIEIDDRTGYSGGLTLKHSSHFAIHSFFYDNNADPKAIKDGQYSWHTRFAHIGVLSPRFGSTRLKAQYLIGDTIMGDTKTAMVNADYSSWYASIDHDLQGWRFTLRYDDFSVDDNDITLMDTNNQDGDAWTIAAAHKFGSNVKVLAEALLIKDRNEARMYFGNEIDQRSTQFQIAIQWRAE